MRTLITVKKVKQLTFGDVLLESEGTWAKMPEKEWDALPPGGMIPSKYLFDSGFWKMQKPKTPIPDGT